MANAIKRQRLRRGWTLREMAGRMETWPSTLMRFEEMPIDQLKLRTLRSAAAALGISLEELIGKRSPR